MKKIDWLLSPLRKNHRRSAKRRPHRDGRCRTLWRGHEVPQQAEVLEARALLSISSVAWVEQGPGPITGGQVLGMDDQGNPVAGAVQAIAIHPTDPNIMVVATARGGIWKTTNALVGIDGIDGIDNDNDDTTDEEEPIWFPKTDYGPTLAMMDIAYSPLDPNVLFAGTGSFSNSGTDAATAGVLQSTDGGETWSQLGTIGSDPFRIRAVVPTRQVFSGQQVLFAGAVQPNNRAAVDTSVGGLFRSRDGGMSWTPLSGINGLPAGAIGDVIADPTDTSGLSLYAVVLGQGVFRTTTGGDSWQSMNGDSGSNPLPAAQLTGSINARLAISNTAGGLQVAVGLVNPPPPTPPPSGGGPSAPIASTSGAASGFFVTNDQGANWTALGIPSDELGNVNLGQQGNRNFVVAAHPTQSGLFYAAGDRTDTLNPSLGITNFVGHIMHTTLGGWTTLVGNAASANGASNPSAPHADARDMEFDLLTNLIQVDDGGIYRLLDPTNAAGQRRWQSMNGNLRVMETYTVAYDSLTNAFLVGSQDTGTAAKGAAAGLSWIQLNQGDGGTVDVGYTSTGSTRYWMGNNFSDLYRTDHTASSGPVSPVKAELRFPPTPDVPENLPLSGLNTDDRQFDGFSVIPYVPNRFDGAKLLLARTGVYLSTDKGDTVTQLTVPGFTGQATAVAYGGRLGGVDAPDVIYVGTDDGALFATFSNGVAPAATTYSGGGIRGLVLDPDDAQNAYVVDDAGRVWRGDAIGTVSESWTNITGNISGSSTATFSDLRSVEVFSPSGGTSDEMLLVGGQGAESLGSGVFFLEFPQFASGDAIAWAEYGANLPNVTVTDIDYIPEDDLLVATTFGRGVWTVPSFADTVVTFARALGGPGHDDPVGIARTTDGGYVVAGTTTSISGNTADLFASKFDPRGNLVWSRTYAGSFVVPTPGGSAGPLTFDYATDIEPTSDGGVVVTGYTNGGGSSGLRVLIDANGDVVGGSTQTFSLSPEDRLTSAADGGNLIGGNVALSFDRNTRVGNNFFQTVLGSKTFAVINGNLYGTKSEIDDFHSGHTTLRQLIKTSAGQTAVVGTQGGGIFFKTIVYTDDAGIVGLGSNEVGVGIVETPADTSGNRFYGVLSSPIVSGTGTGDPDVVVRKLDTSLNMIWERTFPGAAGAIEATADGGFVIASLAAFNKVQLVRLNARGELVWAREYDGRGVEGTTGFVDDIDLIATPYGYVFTVPTTSFGDNDANTETRDFWVVKTDTDGKVPIMTGLMTDITAGFPLTPFTSSSSSAEWFLLPGPQYDNFEDPPGPPPEEGDYDYIEYSNFYLPQNGTILSSVVAAPADGAPREQSTPFYNAGSFQFAMSTAQTTEVTFSEDGTPSQVVDVIVTRTDATHGSYGTARVNYSITFNGGATSSDFSINPLSGGNDAGTPYLSFADGETSQTAFRIFAWNDNDFDPSESITITLLDPDPLNGAVIGTRASTTIEVLNTNPRPGTVQFSSATYPVNENKPSITVTVTRTDATETNMEVSYTVIDDTATGGNPELGSFDFQKVGDSAAGVLTFNNLSEAQTITIPILDDADIEGDETFQIVLSNPTNGGILGNFFTATITIVDVQPPPPLEIVAKFNGSIAFERLYQVGDDFDRDIFVMGSNGSSLTNVTNTIGIQESEPAWSPDGLKLVYAASDFDGADDSSGIYVINADGTGRVRLTSSSNDLVPVWSPDGTRIAFYRIGEGLMVMNSDGSNAEVVLSNVGFVFELKWSPDGTRLAFVSQSFHAGFPTDTIFEVGIDGFGVRRVFPSILATQNFSYTPDGTQMVFHGQIDSVQGIYRANVDGTGTPELLVDTVEGPFESFPNDLALAPEGNLLTYASFDFVGRGLYISNLDGSGAVQLTDLSDETDSNPAWQPLLSNPEPDTQAPSVASVTPSATTITDDFIGEANFSLMIVFSEAMNSAFAPTISFPTENPLTTLTFNAAESVWTSSTTYVAKYDVTDAGKTLSNIDVRVTGGKDLAGNSHNATTSANEFNIAMAGTFHDMTSPKLTSIQRSNPLSEQTTASTLVFLVSFDEEIDPTTIDPTDFIVNGSTATIVSVVPDLFFGAVFSEVTVSGGNLANYTGSVGLSLNPNTDIVDTVGNPVSLMPPEVSEVYLHSSGTPNRVPSFSKGANQTVAEDSGTKTVTNWATNINAGTGDSDQTVDFLVTNNNNALFSSQPEISHNGTLTFTPADNANGTATVTVRVHDNGGTANGGVDTSAAQTFTITVTAVNDAPSFTLENVKVEVLEDAPAQTVNGFVSEISKGAAGESGQTLSFLVTNDNPSLFSKAPAISATGVLTYTLAKNANGLATVTVRAKDNGGVANGGVDTSEAQTFTINVIEVNDIPSFKKGADQSTNEDVAVTVNNWATLINAGAPNESEQELEFLVTTNNDALFAVLPSISANGVLTYTPTLNASGVATVTVQLQDDGDGEAPNVNLSAVQTFKITIKPVNDTPTSSGIAPQVINEDDSTGSIPFTINDVETPAANLALKVLSSTNTKLIPLTGIIFGGTGANRTLTVTPAPNQFGSATIAFTIKDANGGVLTQNMLVTVTPVNDAPPTISNILDVTVAEDTPTAAIKFTVDDVDDKLVNLKAVVVTATSSNAGLVPNHPANIVLGGSAGARTIQLKPAADQFGTTTITVTATDSSGATATDTFLLTVNPVNDAPRVTVATFGVPEYTTNDTMVGTVAAVDPEGNAITSFAIAGGNTGNAFKIDAVTGVIRVNDAKKIDFEALAKYTLTIKATDALGATGTKATETGPVTINVENQSFALTVAALDVDNTVTVSKVGNNLVARRGLVDIVTPTSLEDVSTLTIIGGTAKDTVILDASLNLAGSPATKKFTGQIVINGNEGDDKLDASKIKVVTFGVTFNGGDGNDTALGGAGHDTLNGDDGNDLLSGGAGHDLLNGDRGDDQLLGGAGNDTYLFADTDQIETDTLTETANAGTDLLDFGSVTTAVTAKLTSELALAIHTNRTIKTSATGTAKLAGNFENVIGGTGNDAILGNAAANSLLGGLGNDTIIGGAGNDTLRGGEGDDTTIGGLGNDSIFGDAGTDLGLGGKGGPARGGTSKKESGDVLNVSLETIDEAFATVFGFE